MQIRTCAFLVSLALPHLPAAADFTAPLTVTEDEAQVVGSVYLPFEVALSGLPLGFRICADETVRSVTVFPEPDALGKLLPEKSADANCVALSGVQLSEDSTLIVETGSGSSRELAQAQIPVVDSFRPSRPFRLLRTDAERFVLLSWENGTDMGLICSNRSAALTAVQGKVFGSFDAPSSLAVVGGPTTPAGTAADWQPFGGFTCFSLGGFSVLMSQEVFNIEFVFEDGAVVRHVGRLGS